MFSLKLELFIDLYCCICFCKKSCWSEKKLAKTLQQKTWKQLRPYPIASNDDSLNMI